MGSQREPQKQTEIGSVLESWKTTTIGEYCEILNGYAFKSDDYVTSNGILNFRVVNIEWDGSVSTEDDCKYLPKTFADEYGEYLLNEGDILFVMVGATRGKLTQIPRRILPALMNQNMWRVAIRREGLLQNYFYYYLRRLVPTLLAETEDQARGFFKKADFRALPLALPPLEEQVGIANVLAMVQRAIKRQERLIALTAELKKAVMHKLFTEGTRGEPLKQTEIGLVPVSWVPTPLGSLFAREPSNGMYRPQSDYGRGMLILRIDDFSNDGDTVRAAANRVQATADDSRRFGLETGDIVLNRVNSLSHLGKTALVDELAEPMLFESNMMRFRVDQNRLRSKFAFRVLNSPVVKSQIVGVAKRAVAQSSVNQGDVARLLVPLPPDVAEQDSIISVIDSIEAKQSVHLRARTSYDDLFRALLYQLMTAQVRVNDLDLSALDEPAVEPAGVA